MEQAGNWYEIQQPAEVISPALLVYPDRIKSNIKEMIKMAGGTQCLRPHIKTHKIAEIIGLMMASGIEKFKCATIAEAELLATCGAMDILLAMQPVGLHVARYFALVDKYSKATFSTIVDHIGSIKELSLLAEAKGVDVNLWLDINNGMNRTGIVPNEEAITCYEWMVNSSSIRVRGMHVYDGHIHETDFSDRKAQCDRDFAPVLKMKLDLINRGIEVETIVAGGTPTFPIHLHREDVETSPGTPMLWDQGYSDLFPDMKFVPAAILLTRVVSLPQPHLVCLDLGHKAVASEMALPRIKFLGGKNAKQISQSEEHLVLKYEESSPYNPGDVLYAIPIHICPTVVKYASVLTVENQKIVGSWAIAARDH